MRRRFRNSEDIWPSFADLMSGVSMILLLTGLQLSTHLREAKHQLVIMAKELEEAKRTIGVGEELVAELREVLKKSGIETSVNSYGNLEIPSDLLFDLGKAEIPEAQKDHVTDLGQSLLSLLDDPEYAKSVALIMVVGHTDSVGDANINRTLSTLRARALVESWLTEVLPNREEDDGQRCKAAKLIAAGFGETRPKIVYGSGAACRNQEGERGCRRNRRIEIRIVPKKQDEAEVAGCP